MKNCVAYVRCSTEHQELGPEAQRRDILAWCAVNGYELAAENVFEDRLSGATLPEDSPGLMAAFSRCEQAGIDTLIVAKRDRLGRDRLRFALIERHLSKSGIKLICASGGGNGDGPDEVFMAMIMEAVAIYERLLIKFRTKSALAVKRLRGESTGGQAPYGFEIYETGETRFCRKRNAEIPVRKLRPVPAEQTALETIRSLRAEKKSYRVISTELLQRGIRNRVGQPFDPAQIRRIASRATS